MHQAGPAQDTADSAAPLPGLGADWIAHRRPSHRSASVATCVDPTAVQADADVHDTPATTAAAARRLVIFSMIPPSVPKVTWTLGRRGALPHPGCPQGGTVASTEMLRRRRCHNRVMERLWPRLAVPARPALAVPSRLAAGLAGLAAAAGALAVAEGPGRSTTYAGSSAAGAALTLSAGLALMAAGLVICLGRRPRRTGDLALLAGFTWFAPVWAAWQNGPPLVPSVAMALGGFTFPLILHLVLAYPGGRASSAPARALIAAAYAEALFTAAVLALFRDPYLDPGCLANCNVNAFLVRSLPSLARAIEIADRWFAAAVAVALIAICAARLVAGSRPARRRLLPVAVPAIMFAAAVAARAVALQRTTVEDPFNAGLFTIFAVADLAIIFLATGLISAVARARAERRAIARIAVNLDEAPPLGSLQSALAETLHDPDLRIAYWLPGTQRYVDASGHAVPEPAATSGGTVTRLMRSGRTIAAISHSGAVPGLDSHLGPAIALGVENERLQAELLAQLGELRASRARIVETADAERRRLERDLHDGAQQRLLALSYDIRLARAGAEADGDTAAQMTLGRAIEETQGALEELRELAHGIYPAVLAEAGVAPALATLADTAPLPVQILRADDRRYPAPVEAAAYFTVAEAVDDAAGRGADRAAVTAAYEGGRLVVTVEDNGTGRDAPMVTLADRVGALGGSLYLKQTVCRAEIPCASS
jgi:signal transduction histidine kinase